LPSFGRPLLTPVHLPRSYKQHHRPHKQYRAHKPSWNAAIPLFFDHRHHRVVSPLLRPTLPAYVSREFALTGRPPVERHMTEPQISRIIVAGTGPTGMMAALGLARAGFSVTLAGPAPRRDDQRTVALMRPALASLDGVGVLARVADQAAPLSVMRIVDA